MLSTSGVYNFQSISAELIIREAYERIGILGDFTTAQQLDSATRSLNFLLSDWSNRNINLWTLETFFIGLHPGVNSYKLPIENQNIIQAELRTSNRQLLGTAQSNKGGNADNAFDGNPLTSCEQNDADGTISYDYPGNNKRIINFVGIQSNKDAKYNIVIEGITGGDTFTLKDLGATTFYKGKTQWFEVLNIVPYEKYSIREIGGKTLDIQEIYFNNGIVDNSMTEVSRYDYLTYPKKNMLGRPTVYYVNYQIEPVITIWQTPSPVYNCMFYSAQKVIQTVESYTDSIDIQGSFYQPLIYGLAELLAIKYAPDKVQMMGDKYEQSMQLAVVKNSVEVPLTLGVYGK
jgi:hypothetical protein